MKITLNNIESVFKVKKCSVETMELKGYTLVKEYFVDNSGFGMESEPAYTANGFINQLTELIKTEGSLVAKITNQGQFQVYLGLFKKTGKNLTSRVANNVLKIETDSGFKIRLYDTDIVTIEGDKTILNSGNWHTNTTKKYMNMYISNGYVFQHDFKWYVRLNGKEIPFTDGMTV